MQDLGFHLEAFLSILGGITGCKARMNEGKN